VQKRSLAVADMRSSVLNFECTVMNSERHAVPGKD
jgi:hypothetical protein